MVQNSPRGEVPLTDKVTRARSRQERSGGHRGHPPYPCERLPYSSPPDTPVYIYIGGKFWVIRIVLKYKGKGERGEKTRETSRGGGAGVEVRVPVRSLGKNDIQKRSKVRI
jgi:hypothetical protein